MATVHRIDGDLEVSGYLLADQLKATAGAITDSGLKFDANLVRSKLALDTLKPYAIPLTALRVHDALSSSLPNTAASDDLALVPGTYGVDAPILSAGDCKASTVTRYARVITRLPVGLDVDNSTVAVRVYAGMGTTLSDTSATLDLACRLYNRTATLGSSISAGGAQSINDLSPGAYDFILDAIDALGTAGNYLDMRFAVAVVDSATGTAVDPEIYAIDLLCDVRG